MNHTWVELLSGLVHFFVTVNLVRHIVSRILLLDFTEVLLDNLKDTFPSVNFIGIRLLPSRDAGSFIRRYHGWTDEEYAQNHERLEKE